MPDKKQAELYARRLAREVSAREQAETLLEQKSLELFNQALQRERAAIALRESEERYRLIVELSPDAILIEIDEKIVFTNHAARLLFCEAEGDCLSGKGLLSLADSTCHQKVADELQRLRNGHHQCSESEELAVRLNGSTFEVAVQRVTLTYNGKNAVQMIARDISSRKQLEHQLAYQATHDPLTGIPNRKRLLEILSEALNYADRYQFPVWVAFLDLDRFKFINDHYGHRVGDKLLINLTRRLQAVMRKTDTVGRYGGDEFILMLRGGPEDNMNAVMVERIMASVNEPMEIDGHHLQLSCSLGLAMYPDNGTTPDSLIDNADIAMYRAKESGRNRYQFYTQEMNQQHQERSQIESALYNVLESGELFLEYQPQLDLQSGQVKGVEALLRWQHPELGLLTPSRFISIAEESGMIGPIGKWIIKQACQQCAQWQQAGLGKLRVAVNLSVRQLDAYELFSTIETALAVSALTPDCLELELTETLMMSDLEHTLEVLNKLRKMGVTIAVDDFGTGFSSFTFIKQLPLDCLKIDQSFIQELANREDNKIIVRTFIQLAHNLKLRVIAEGVETPYQREFLHAHGCDEIQGYVFCKPLLPQAMGVWLKEHL